MGFGQGLGCTGTCAKYLLFLINFAVFLSGAALLAVGIVLLVDSDAIDWISDITGGTDMNDDLFRTAVYMIITVGSLLFLVGFLGCCGACKENTCLLQLYVILVCILLVCEVTAGILAAVFIGEVDEKLEETMRTSVQDKYGADGQNTTTVAWDAMQIDFKCCGSVSYQDYVNSTFKDTTGYSVPMSCCAGASIKDEEVSLDPTLYAICRNSATAGNGTGDNSVYFEKGCYTSFEEWVKDNTALLMGIAFGLGALQLLGVIAACCIKSKIEDTSYHV